MRQVEKRNFYACVTRSCLLFAVNVMPNLSNIVGLQRDHTTSGSTLAHSSLNKEGGETEEYGKGIFNVKYILCYILLHKNRSGVPINFSRIVACSDDALAMYLKSFL